MLMPLRRIRQHNLGRRIRACDEAGALRQAQRSLPPRQLR